MVAAPGRVFMPVSAASRELGAREVPLGGSGGPCRGWGLGLADARPLESVSYLWGVSVPVSGSFPRPWDQGLRSLSRQG